VAAKWGSRNPVARLGEQEQSHQETQHTVQFLAPFDGKHFLCEAASAKTAPELAATLTSEKEELLYDIGFEAVGISPNYSQTVEIESVEDIGYAARLAFRVLKQIYGVTSYGSGKFELNPSDASN
jgi:hypothetical protein